MKKIYLFSFLLLCCFPPAYSQSESASLGNFRTLKKDDSGLVIKTDHGNLKVTVYSATIIKFDVTLNTSFNDFSYAVVATPEPANGFSVKDEKEQITLTTDSVQLVISKKPVRLSCYTKDGKLLNADDAAFGTGWNGEEITAYKKLFPDEKFIGLGEKTGSLNRRGSGYVNWNTDAPGYTGSTDPIYSSIPFYIGMHDSLTYGIFLDNSSRSTFNFGASQNRFSSFTVEDGDMNYFIIANSTVAGIIESYTRLTGRMQLPPLWSLGFNQCKWSYYPESKILNLAHTFRDKKIPCDVLWFDIHYMQDYKVFTWNHDRFPDPKRMLDECASLGFKNVCIIDPGIKAEPGYSVYDEGLKKNLFLKYPDGTVYNGAVWPGWCAFTDFTLPQARTWWGGLFKQNIEDGMDGFWCDMNEIATWGQTVPSIIGFNGDGHPFTYRTGKNIYGLEMARATFDGEKTLLNGKRPFVLTRAGFAGLQRYTAIWTGDNQSTDDHMLLGVRLLNSLGLSGVAFAGVDAGGFAGEGSPDLMARWISIAAFSPFFRAHKEINRRDAEPWAFGDRTENICRSYIQLHYNLLPYLYSVFYEATQTGMPVQRSLAINYATDQNIYDGNAMNEYLFGPSLLIIPCPSSQQSATAYLPAGTWFDFYSNKKYEGQNTLLANAPLERLPVFVKAGAIIPEQSPVQSTAFLPDDTLTLHVYNGADGSFDYYEDAGDGYGYQSGQYYQRRISLDVQRHQLLIEQPEGSYVTHYKVLRVVFHGFESIRKSISVNGISFRVERQPVFFMPLLNTEATAAGELPVLYLKNTNSQFQIAY